MYRLGLSCLLAVLLAASASAQFPTATIDALTGTGSLGGGTPGNFGNAIARVSANLDLVVADSGYDTPYEDGVDFGAVHHLDGPITRNLLGSFYGQAAGDEFGFAVAAIDDLDQDGLLEVAISAPGGGYVKIVDLSSGTLTTIMAPESAEDFGRGLGRVSDLSGDGFADLVVASRNQLHFYDLATGNLIGGLATITDGGAPGAAIALAIYDYDQDGYLDVVTADVPLGRIEVISGEPADLYATLGSHQGSAGIGLGSAMAVITTASGTPDVLAVGAPIGFQVLILGAQTLQQQVIRPGIPGGGYGGSLAAAGRDGGRDILGLDPSSFGMPPACLFTFTDGFRRSALSAPATTLVARQVFAFGDVLGDGEAEFLVRYVGSGSDDRLFFYQGAPPASYGYVGSAAAPVGQFPPSLTAGSTKPYFGNATFGMTAFMGSVTDVALMFGDPIEPQPIPGFPANYQLHVDPTLGTVHLSSFGLYSLPISNDPVFSGRTYRAQAAGFDAQGNLYLTRALEFTIGFRP